MRDIPGRDAVERLPKMHRKTQLIVPMEALQALARAPEFPPALDAALRTEMAGELGEGPLYFLTGSVNENTRSLALDGEVLAVVAGGPRYPTSSNTPVLRFFRTRSQGKTRPFMVM